MKKQEEKGPRTPIYRNAGFELETSDRTASAFISETENEHVPEQYIYSRYRNPTVVSAEKAIMNVEACKWALLAESGMAAIDIALSIFQEAGKKGKWLFSSEIYGGTLSFISSVLVNRRGIDIEFFSPEGLNFDYDRIEQQVKDTKPEILYFEAISNPLLIVADGRRLIRIAKDYGCKVIIDNTFATPALWKPLDDGADLVIHSATKYFGGHGNITAGVICGNDRTLMQKSIEYRKFTGHMLSPDDAYRLETQLASFFLRYRQQCRNAEMISNLLTDSEKVDSVYYPGLPTHSTHKVAETLFDGRGYGAMITFDLCGANNGEKKANRDRFIERVSSEIKLVPTLGDSHTILMPVEPVWGSKYHEPGMIRLSVGFEETEKLLDLISSGLK